MQHLCSRAHPSHAASDCRRYHRYVIALRRMAAETKIPFTRHKQGGTPLMNPLLIGNLSSLCAMVTDSLSARQKTGKGVLIMQTLSQAFYVLGAVVLKGYSAAVQNAVSILRNICAIRKWNSKVLEWAFVIVALVLGLLFNNLGFVGLLPVIANLQYSLCVFRYRDNERALKISFVFCTVAFSIFNAVIQNYVGTVSNLVVMVTLILYLVKNRKPAEN
jgi:hypothetical protein